MNESNLPETVAFYKRANWLLRIALIYAVLWPFGAMAIALYLTSYNAKTIITLFEFSLFILVFLCILGAPYKYFLQAQDPDAKVALRWAGILVAVELSFGFYVFAIPIANDPALIPYLIFSITIIFILNFIKAARWAVHLLTLVIIGITIVFICGGRTTFKEFNAQVINPPNTPRNSSPVYIPPPSPAPPRQTISVQQTLPSAQISQSPAAPPPPAQPAPFQPDWDKAQHFAVEEFLFVSAPCIKRAANVHCFFRVTNLGKTVGAEIDGHYLHDYEETRMIDEQGNVYVATSVSLGSSQDTGRAINTLPSNVRILGSLVFENVTGARAALLEIKCNLDDSYRHQLVAGFRDLPIQLDDGTMLSHTEDIPHPPPSNIQSWRRFASAPKDHR